MTTHVLSTHRATLDDCLGLRPTRGVVDVPTVQAIASSIDAGRSAAAPADDLGPILDAPPGLCDEQGAGSSGRGRSEPGMSDSDEPVVAGSERGELTDGRGWWRASLQSSGQARGAAADISCAAADTRILPRAADESCPLSLTQQRLWFLDQLFPGSPAYNEPTALRSRRLDSASLSRALDEIVGRHEALRTVFVAAESEPYQVVQAPSRSISSRLTCPHSRARHARRRSRRRWWRWRGGLSTCPRAGRSGRG